jgi:hypothetical protein
LIIHAGFWLLSKISNPVSGNLNSTIHSE